MAWVWHFSKNTIYQLHQNVAKQARKGIWSNKKAIDPYKWRMKSKIRMKNNM